MIYNQREREAFINSLRGGIHNSEIRRVAEKIIAHEEGNKDRGLIHEIWYGPGDRDKSCVIRVLPEVEIFTIWSYKSPAIWIPIEAMKEHRFFREKKNCDKLMEEIECIVSVDRGSSGRPKKNPTIELVALQEDSILSDFLRIMDRLAYQVRNN